MPDFKTIPNKDGQLPVAEEIKNSDGELITITHNFPDGKNDDRWYDWSYSNWGTKWDACDKEIEDEEDWAEITFNTAWSPPEGIFRKIKDHFPDGKNDDRWYHWCVDNWGTKWEPDMHGNEMSDYDSLEITFNTAWSPPEGVVEKLREKFPELSFQCFYDEPGCEIAGYY